MPDKYVMYILGYSIQTPKFLKTISHPWINFVFVFEIRKI